MDKKYVEEGKSTVIFNRLLCVQYFQNVTGRHFFNPTLFIGGEPSTDTLVQPLLNICNIPVLILRVFDDVSQKNPLTAARRKRKLHTKLLAISRVVSMFATFALSISLFALRLA